jgi:alpha-methylacyl-CoA racemase
MERLGLGPDIVLARNRKLVYARMTGWGQTGPRAPTAGHDIDYIAITGALHAIGAEDPVVPLNLVGDYGGGALYLAMGTLAAVLNARTSGSGQVVDCAICDGTVSLLSLMHGLRHAGRWRDSRQANVLDGAAPFYRTYRCADGRYVAVGAIEPPFYKLLLDRLGLSDDPLFAQQHDRNAWVQQTAAIRQVFLSRPRDAWADAFAGHGRMRCPRQFAEREHARQSPSGARRVCRRRGREATRTRAEVHGDAERRPTQRASG